MIFYFLFLNGEFLDLEQWLFDINRSGFGMGIVVKKLVENGAVMGGGVFGKGEELIGDHGK